MKKFKISFTVAFVLFALFYIFATVKGAKNPFENLFSKSENNDPKNEKENDDNKDKEPDDIGDIEDGNKIEQIVHGEYFFVLMGIDGDDVMSKTVQRSRTDTMILCKVNFDTGAIVMMNLPRDTYCSVRGQMTKMNHSHAYGGTQLVMKTIRDFTGLDVDYFVKVDYKLVTGLVDAIGGVEFDVPLDMKYADPTADPPFKVDVKKGMQTLSGSQALGVLRWRHNQDYTLFYPQGDIGRIATQQALMKEIAKQALSLKNVFKLPDIIKQLKSNIDTNFTDEQIAKACISAFKLNPELMTTLILPGDGKTLEDGISYYVPYKDQAEAMFKEHFGDYKKN